MMLRKLSWEDGENCTEAAIKEFPQLNLSSEWGLIAPALIITASVLLLAKLCETRFVPCIKIIAYGFGLSSDVAGGTLMAAAVSSPDLFINLLGTFLMEGDIGLGTVLGCGVINTLALPALCIFISSATVIKLNYWALSRDCLIYMGSMVVLVATLYDGRVAWYEAFILVFLYFVYIIVMAYSGELRGIFERCWKKTKRRGLESQASLPLLMKPIMSAPYGLEELLYAESQKGWKRLVEIPNSLSGKLLWLIWWPFEALIYITVPPPTLSLFINSTTFLISLGYIASLSYIVSWMITNIGFRLSIPDSLMGITFLAVGMSVPESLASIIVAKQGHGSMAISNALGSNIFDVLICLGVPWLIKASFFSQTGFVEINSRGLGITTGLLLSTLVVLYVSLASNRFQLNNKVGVMCFTLYILFCIFATLVELNVFFVGNLPSCPVDY